MSKLKMTVNSERLVSENVPVHPDLDEKIYKVLTI